MAEVMLALGPIMSSMMTAASSAGTFLAANAGTIGTALAAGGTIYGGLQANAQSKVEAKGLKKKGDAEFSSAQREAMDRRRQTQLVVSRQKAVSAASGGGATDDSVTAVMEKTQAEGDYNAMMDMYNGSVNRADLYSEAKTVRKEGKSKLIGSFIDAGTTIYGDMAKRQRTQKAYAT